MLYCLFVCGCFFFSKTNVLPLVVVGRRGFLFLCCVCVLLIVVC